VAHGYELNVIPPTGSPTRVALDGELLIGRDGGCGLCLDHPTVSSNHALLTVKGSSVAIQDLASTNGTTVGGTEVKGEQWLRGGAIVQIGAFRLELIPPRGGRDQKTAPLRQVAAQLDERDRGVIDTLLKDWGDPGIQIPAIRGAEEMAADLHCSRQEVNRRVKRLETKLGIAKGRRGQQRYHALAEELLRRGLAPRPRA